MKPINLNELRRFLISLAIVVLIVVMIAAENSAAETINMSPDVSPAKKVAFMGRPSVVLITCDYKGTLLNENDEAKVYLHPASSDKKISLDIPEFSINSMGSGFIVSPDGYIVTNAHVVEIPEDELKNQFVDSAVQWAIDKYPEIFSANGDEPYPQTQEDVVEIRNEFKKYKVTSQRELNVYFGSSSSVSSATGHPADTREVSQAKIWYTSGNIKYRSGKDVAILKIEGVRDLPTNVLGDSDDIEAGDTVIVIGYPGTTLSQMVPQLSPQTDLVPSVTSGIVSARKRLPDGSDALQTDASIYHGSSGGPAFDSQGRIIGVATFGSGKMLSSGDWVDIQGFNFLIPINVVKSFLAERSINNSVSATANAFKFGLDYYWNKQYDKAKEEFGKILEQDPTNQYALDYSRMCTQH